MVLLGLVDVDIYEEVKDATICGTDEYDRPLKCPNLVTSVKGNLQKKRPAYTNTPYGPIQQSKYLLELPSNVDTSRLYKVAIDGYSGYFRVEAVLVRQLLPGIQVDLIKER
jgi:hypothetical protein